MVLKQRLGYLNIEDEVVIDVQEAQVNRIVAGEGITISPPEGTGEVLINCTGGGGGSIGDDSQRFTADSLLSSAGTSSVARDAYTYKYAEKLSTGETEYKEATGYCFSLYNFKHAEGAIDLSLALSNDYRLPDRYKILVRDNQEKLGQQTKPVLKYATLSVEVPAMSVDSQMSGTNSWSV